MAGAFRVFVGLFHKVRDLAAEVCGQQRDAQQGLLHLLQGKQGEFLRQEGKDGFHFFALAA